MSTQEWKDTNLKRYLVSFGIASGIPKAISECAKKSGIKETALISKWIKEKLREEGYIKQDYSGPHGKLIK